MRALGFALRLSALVEIVYFTASHWLFREYFFGALGIVDGSLESTFVQSQLQLIGALVGGVALLMWLTARDPLRYRSMVLVLLVTGGGCIAIFVAHVGAGTLPPQFLANAALLAVQVMAIALLYPWQARPGLRLQTHRSGDAGDSTA